MAVAAGLALALNGRQPRLLAAREPLWVEVTPQLEEPDGGEVMQPLECRDRRSSHSSHRLIPSSLLLHGFEQDAVVGVQRTNLCPPSNHVLLSLSILTTPVQ